MEPSPRMANSAPSRKTKAGPKAPANLPKINTLVSGHYAQESHKPRHPTSTATKNSLPLQYRNGRWRCVVADVIVEYLVVHQVVSNGHGCQANLIFDSNVQVICSASGNFDRGRNTFIHIISCFL